ncbi:MAG TPA: alpha/beta hydrolase [Geobacteraceae bacterium]
MRQLDSVKIVFMPGLDGTGISFEPIAKVLPPTVAATVITYPNVEQSFEESVNSAAAQFPPDEDSLVIAESFSGPVAIELLASGRIKAKGLVLAATFASSPRKTLLPLFCSLPLNIFLGLPVPELFLCVLLGKGETLKNLMPMWKRIHAAVSPRVLAHRIGVVREVDVTKRLPNLQIPTCYIQAENDAIVPSTALRAFAEALPGLTVRKIQGPHLILQAQPAQSLAIIQEFNELMTNRGRRPPLRSAAAL